MFCSAAAAAFRDILMFVQKLRVPQYAPNVEFEEYFRLEILDRTAHRVIEAENRNYLDEHCFAVQQFMLQLQEISSGALHPLNLVNTRATLEMQSWEMVAFFDKTPVSNEYSQCLGAWEKGIMPLTCVDNLTDGKFAGLHATFASLSLYYLKMAKLTAHDNPVGSFLTDFRLTINGNTFMSLRSFCGIR